MASIAFRPALVLTGITRRQYRLIEHFPSNHSNIWIAQSLSEKRKVVIKSPLHNDPLHQQAAKVGLETEMLLLSGVLKGRSGIRQLVDRITLIEEPDQIQAAVLEYGEKTLHGFHIVEKGRLSPNQVKTAARQLLKALAFIHEKGIVHTDIKPENILITRQPKPGSDDIEVKLMDFGSASHVDYEWRDQKTNPAWRSPESWMGMEVTTASEVWALGAIFASLYMGGPNILFRPIKEPRGLDEEGSINWVRSMYTVLPFPESIAQRAPKIWQDRFESFKTSPQMYKTLPTEFSVLGKLFRIPDDAWNVVYNMLQVDPEQRMPATELLATEYFLPRWKHLLNYYAIVPILPFLQWVLDKTWNACIIKLQAEAKAEASRSRD